MCYNLELLFLKSKTNKELCVAISSNNVSDTTGALSQITVKLFVNDINHQYVPIQIVVMLDLHCWRILMNLVVP